MLLALKTCTKCAVDQDTDCFTPGKHWCKTCVQSYNAAYRIEHSDRLQPTEGMPGSDTLSNLAVACIPCNSRKRNKIVESGAYAC